MQFIITDNGQQCKYMLHVIYSAVGTNIDTEGEVDLNKNELSEQ